MEVAEALAVAAVPDGNEAVAATGGEGAEDGMETNGVDGIDVLDVVVALLLGMRVSREGDQEGERSEGEGRR